MVMGEGIGLMGGMCHEIMHDTSGVCLNVEPPRSFLLSMLRVIGSLGKVILSVTAMMDKIEHNSYPRFQQVAKGSHLSGRHKSWQGSSFSSR